MLVWPSIGLLRRHCFFIVVILLSVVVIWFLLVVGYKEFLYPSVRVNELCAVFNSRFLGNFFRPF